MCTSRTMPTKLATAPTPSRRARIFVSRERSKSSRCTEIFTSAPGHRRKERDLVAGADRRAGLGHVLVHGGAHVLLFRERAFPGAAAAHEMAAQRSQEEDFHFHQ